MKKNTLFYFALLNAIMIQQSYALSKWEEAKQSTRSALKKTKETASYGYQKASKKTSDLIRKATTSWNMISPQTKKTIKNTLIAIGAMAGTAFVAGASYGAYTDKSRNSGAPLGSLEDKETFDQLIQFLSNDPNYKGEKAKQEGFLERFNLNDDAKQNIMSLVG